MASFQNRIRVWESTKDQSNKYFPVTKQSIKYDYTNLPEPYLNRKFDTTQVLTWKLNPIDTVSQVVDKLGCTFPVLLNIANSISPGNNIELGGPGQEENLYRRSNYCLSLNSATGFYPIPDDSCIYSPEVVIFREGEITPAEDYEKTQNDLYNLRSENPDNTNFKVPDERDNFYNLLQNPRTISVIAAIREIELVFRIAANYGHDSIILYANGTSNIETFRKWMEHYNGVFKYVIFALENETNFQAFLQEFSKPLKQLIVPELKPEITKQTETSNQTPNKHEVTKPVKQKQKRNRIRYRIKTS